MKLSPFMRGYLETLFVLIASILFLLCGFAFAIRVASRTTAPQPAERPTTLLLPQNPAVLVLVSPVDDDQITTDTLAGLHNAGMLAYRRAVETELTLIAKGRTE